MKKIYYLFMFLLLLKIILLPYTSVFFDEGIYVGIAKNFASQGGHFESIRPLALPALLTPLQFLPTSSLTSGRIFSLLLILTLLTAIYFTTKKAFNETTAFWTTFIYAASVSTFFNAGLILTDLTAYSLIFLATLLTYQKRYFYSGLMTGLAFLFKFPAPLILIPLAILTLTRKNKLSNLSKLALGSILTATPYFIFNLMKHGSNFLQPLLDASALIEKESWVYANGTLLRYLAHLTFTEISFILAIISSFYLWKNHKQQLFYFASPAIIFLTYFIVRVPRYDPRYTMPMIPFLALISAIAITDYNPEKIKKYALLAIILIPTIIITLFTFQPINHTPFEINALSLTNTAFTLLETSNRSDLTFSQDLGGIYTQYVTQNYSYLLITPDSFLCPTQVCQDKINSQISQLLHNAPIQHCNYFHNMPLIIVSKNPKISPQDCANNLNLTLEPKTLPKINLIVSNPIRNKDSFSYQENINKIAKVAAKKQITTTIVFETPTGIDLSTVKNWTSGELYQNLDQQLQALKITNKEINIELPGYLLYNSNTKIIEEFIQQQ